MTKPSSSSRKQNSGSAQSKFSIMRKKLKLRPRTSPVQHEINMKREKNTDRGKTIGGEQTEKFIKEEDILKDVKAKKFFQRASPMKLVRLYKSLSEDQHDLIRSEDYGGLLDIRCSKLQPELCQFLAESFDPSSCMMVFPGRGSIPVTEVSVQEVIGVPLGDLDVMYGLDPDSIKFMEKQLGKTGQKQPTIASIEQRLVSMKKANNKFLRHFIGYAMSSILAPTTAVRISPRLYPSLVNIKLAKRLNMCKFVVMIMCKALKPSGNSNVMPCMLYLMVKYLDSLELQGMDISEEGTRVSVWTNALIKKAIDQDKGSDGCFGAAPLKPAFRNTQATSGPLKDETRTVSSQEHEEQTNTSPREVESDTGCNVHCDSEKVEVQDGHSIFFSDPEKFDRFIEVYAPKGLTPEDKARYKELIEYACQGFETGLQMMMRTIPYRPENKGTSAGQSQARGSTDRNNVKEGSELLQGSDKEFKTEDRPENKGSIAGQSQARGTTDRDSVKEGSEDGGLVRRNKRAKKEEKAPATMEDNNTRQEKAPKVPKETSNCKLEDEDTTVLALPCQDKISSDTILRTMATSDDAPTKPNETSLPANTPQDANIPEDTSNIQHQVPQSVGYASTSRSNVLDIPEQKNKPYSADPAKGSTASAVQAAACEDVVPPNNVKEGSELLQGSDKEFKTKDRPENKGSIAGQSQARGTTDKDSVKEGSEDGGLVRRNKRAKKEEKAPATMEDNNTRQEKAPKVPKETSNCKFEDEVTTFKFTHLDARKTEHIASLLRNFRRKNIAEVANVTEEVTEKENVAPSSSKFVDIGATSTKSDDSAISNSGCSSSLDGVESFDEENNSSNSEEKRREFLAYVASSTPGRRKFDIPLLEEAVFFDMETARPAQDTFQSIIENLKPINMEEAAVGLPSLLDDNARHKAEVFLSKMEQKLVKGKRKTVTFAGQQKKRQKKESTIAAPSPSRYRTRAAARLEASNSPNKVDTTRDAAPTTSPIPELNKDSKLQAHVTGPTSTPGQENSAPKTLTPTVPISAWQNSMNRQLVFDSALSDKVREAARRAPDAPTFDISLDTPPECNEKEEENQEAKATFATQGGCNNANAEPATFTGQEGCSNANANANDKRVPRKGKQVKASTINPKTANTYTVSTTIDNLYWMVCEHGWKRNPGDPVNGKTAVDIETFFVDFGLLGDSVAPRSKLANSVAECAINIIRAENPNPKKVIMPLRISRYLIDCRLDLKDMTRCFQNTTAKLDEKDEICFPTLEKFPDQATTEPAGHYWLVVLNIKAQRFEILDSLAKNGEPLMIEPCHYMITSIKTMWARQYNTSKVQIATWPTEVIESPAQDNLYDCGFFMLKNLEEKNGLKVASFTQKDLPNIRKLYTDKWLRANKTNEWKTLV